MKKPLSLLLLPVLAAGCVRKKEVEPNDHFTQATAVPLDCTVKGTVASASDVDVFRLDVEKDSAALAFSLGGIRDVDFVLSLQDKDRVELKRYDETGVGGDEEALDLGVHKGVYYLVLSNKNPQANNSKQEYALRLAEASAEGNELEPNDKMLDANALAPGVLLKGHYFPTANLLLEDADKLEEDWFKVSVGSGQFILNLDVSETPKVQPVLEIYDANAYKVKELEAGDPGAGVSLRGFGVRGPAEYFLRLRPKQPRAGNSEVAYQVLSELLPYRGEIEFEPNDQRLEATVLERESIVGTINPKGDADWYRVSVDTPARQILAANVSALPGMDLRLDFTDELGNPKLAIDNAGKEQPEVLTGVGLSPGSYYLVVSEKSGKASEARRSYTLSRSLIPAQNALEYELNDSSRTAQKIQVGESVDGYIAPKGDVDYYEFNVYQKGGIVVETTGVLNVQLSMTLLDQDFRELLSQSGKKPGDSVSLVQELEPGTYAIRLQPVDSAQNNVRDKYTLRVRVQ